MSDMPEPIVQNYHLIKALQKEVAFLKSEDCKTTLIERLITEIAALRAPQWISIETEMPKRIYSEPDESAMVLIAVGDTDDQNEHVTIDSTEFGEFHCENVTHWMYFPGLPTPPDDCE